MTTALKLNVPPQGQKITIANGRLTVPDQPIIPFIEGDGTGADIWRASVRVLDAAVAKAYGGKRKIHWMEVYAGQKSNDLFNTWLPDETVQACRDYLVSKGIEAGRIVTVGYGDERPIASNETEQGRQRNRRIEAAEM
jgi:isocitrate dehydrogenase